MISKKRVLICEDTPSIRKLLELFFQKRGFETCLAEDGIEALKAAAQAPPDLVVMDLIMPGMDGIEAVRSLRAGGYAGPIVMMTSKAYIDDRDRALKAGATAYLLKPINPSKIDEVIKPLLSS